MKSSIKAVLIGLTIALSGCAVLNEAMGIPVNKGNGYTIIHDKNIRQGAVHVEYRSQEFLEAEKRKQGHNRMMSESDIQAEIDLLPQGGFVLVTYEEWSVKAANTKWLEYVVLADGEEVYRRKGSDKIPNLPSSNGRDLWWNVDSVALPLPIENKIEFVVISNILNLRDTFTISATQPK